MALGAWLPLFQMQLAPGTGGPGADGAESITTFAPNQLPLTGFFDSSILEIAKLNAQALVKGASAESLTSDLTVTEGHRHEGTHEAVLRWRQIVSMLFVNHGAAPILDAPDQANDALMITEIVETDFAMGFAWLSSEEAASIIPRVRVSTDGTATVTAWIALRFYTLAGTLFKTIWPAFIVSTDTLQDRVWYEGDPIDLRDATADATVTERYPVLVKISGILSSADAALALHELSLGVET